MRPAPYDPAGQGQQVPTVVSAPAAEVYTGVGVEIGDDFAYGMGITDAQGRAVVEVDLPKYLKPGKAMVSIFSWKQVASLPCVVVSEIGYTVQQDAFTVR